MSNRELDVGQVSTAMGAAFSEGRFADARRMNRLLRCLDHLSDVEYNALTEDAGEVAEPA